MMPALELLQLPLLILLGARVHWAQAPSVPNHFGAFADCEACVEAGFGWSQARAKCGMFVTKRCPIKIPLGQTSGGTLTTELEPPHKDTARASRVQLPDPPFPPVSTGPRFTERCGEWAERYREMHVREAATGWPSGRFVVVGAGKPSEGISDWIESMVVGLIHAVMHNASFYMHVPGLQLEEVVIPAAINWTHPRGEECDGRAHARGHRVPRASLPPCSREDEIVVHGIPAPSPMMRFKNLLYRDFTTVVDRAWIADIAQHGFGLQSAVACAVNFLLLPSPSLLKPVASLLDVIHDPAVLTVGLHWRTFAVCPCEATGMKPL